MAGGGCCARRGGWRRSDQSEASDLDLAVVDAREHAGGSGRRRTTASGGGAARDRARGLSFMCGSHRDVESEAANSSRASRSARMRRGQRAVRRCGAVRRCYSSELPTTTRCTGTTTSGTGGLLTSLCDSGKASRRREGDDDEGQRQWRLGFQRARAQVLKRRLGFRLAQPWVAAALNRLRARLGVRAKLGRRARGGGTDSDSSPDRALSGGEG
jgi:hypothetical protein